MTDSIYFSLYQGVPDYPVTIFNEARWTLENQVRLDTCIIGKSHRVISRWGEFCFTEFIACSDEIFPNNYMDRFQLLTGKNRNHIKEYRSGALTYRVNIEVVDHIYANMDDFLESIDEKSAMDMITHKFRSSSHPQTKEPFTGLAVDFAANSFHTIHTYPEDGISILSKSELSCPVHTPAI